MIASPPPSHVASNIGSSELSIPDFSQSLIGLLRIVRVRARVIIGVAVLVVAITAAIVMQMRPMYTSTAVVMLDERRNNIADSSAVLSDLPSGNQATVQNQVQILTSLELAGRVVDNLHLVSDPEFNPDSSGWFANLRFLNPLNWFAGSQTAVAHAKGEDLERSRAVHVLLNHLTVTPIGQSTAIQVAVMSVSPAKAALLANGVANAYVEDQLEAKFEATRKATEWLSTRIGELAKQAQVADAAVQQYKAENNISRGADGGSVIDQQVADINRQLVLAKTDLAEKQANYNRLASMSRAGNAADASQVLASPLIANLRAQETVLNGQIANLATKYGPRHPRMLDLQAQKDDLAAKITEEVQRVVEAARSDVVATSTHVASLEGSLKQVEAQGANQNQAEVQLTALQSNATSARAMYEAFLSRLNQTRGQEGIQSPDGRIISVAEASHAPSSPKKILDILYSIPIGLLLGLGIAYLLERFDTGFRTPGQIESLIGFPVLATVPEVGTPDKSGITGNPNDLVIDKLMSSYAEALRGLQLNLQLYNVDKRPKVVLVASSVPSEGKTSLSASLARTAVRQGLRTLIVDADMRHPSVASALGIGTPERGLPNALAGDHLWHDCLVKDPRSDLVVLPGTLYAANPGDALASARMENLLKEMSSAFDLVIIDTAPLLPVHDTRVLLRLVDAVVFTVRWEKTPREAVADAIHSLDVVREKVAGIVLTRADQNRFRHYSYGYQDYHKYSTYYQE